jgi:phage-related protein (TIGR01555 family)
MGAMTSNILMRAADGLMNALTGAGGRNDSRTGNSYGFTPLTQHQIEAAYRGSGMMRKIIDIPALDVVREWREWRGESDGLADIVTEERRLSIPQKVMLAETLRGLGGGAFVLGLPGLPEEPAKPGAKGSLAFIHVVSRWQITAHEWVDDALDPLFGGPRYWTMNSARGQQKIHTSRVICFKGDAIPSLAQTTAQEDLFWGESRVQRVLDAVQNSDTAQTSFTNLISKAKLTRIGIPGLMELVGTAAGEANLAKRLSAIATSESIYNHSVYDSGDADGKGGEKMDDVTYSFAGMKDVMDSYGMWVAAISDIPATRLLGRSPEGMNSSGDGQQKDWNKQIRARQTLQVGPCLDALDQYLIPSAIGSTPPDTWYEFPPLDLPDEKVVAETFKLNMEAATALRDMGAVPDQALNEGVQSLLTEQGYLPALEAALKKVPDAERFGVEQQGPDGEDPSALTQPDGL